MKYSIEDTTLTGIADALRRKHGETHKEPLYLDYVVSSSNNITSADGVNSGFVNFAYENTITIPNAVRLFIKLTYIAAEHMMPNFVFTINDTVYSTNLHNKTYSEINLDGDTVTFKYTASGKGIHCYYAEISGYDADGNIILNDTGETVDIPNTYKSSEMAQAIDNIPPSPPEEAFVISETCSYRFAYGGWDWFIKLYGNKITTENITTASYMFNGSSITELPFEINFKNGGGYVDYMFSDCTNLESVPNLNFKHTNYNSMKDLFTGCTKLKEIGTIENAYPSEMNETFKYCERLRQLPEFINLNLSRIRDYEYSNNSSMFYNCHSLRNISEDFLKQFYGKWTAQFYTHISNCFNSCYVLDEIRGLNPQTGIITSNMFGNSMGGTFSNCHRLKNIIFDTQDDGTPYVVKWKSQIINLSANIGYEYNLSNHIRIVGFNSGITMDKQVTDDVTYQALKDDPDWWTSDVAYSRYNHDSAVATINSLPDTSAYLASAGGTNTIEFNGAAGSATDGGAINTLTEEEIAVATAKGWTVTLV